MKTLNLTLRAILLFLILVSTATEALAYSFRVNGICYNINGNEATVTYLSMYYSGSVAVYVSDYTGDVVIPKTVTYNGTNYTVTGIGERAFIGCDGLTNVTIPETVTTIGPYAFYKCTGLSIITIPDAVISIGKEAFFQCKGLTNITIGKSMASIGEYAFFECSKLKAMASLAVEPPAVGNYAISGSSANLYVPIEYVDLYRTKYPWNSFSNIIGFGQNTLSMADFTTLYGDTIVIPVTMENVDDITAFQTDLYLPAGFELLKDGDDYMVSLSSRKGRDHVIMTNDAPDGAVRILSYSPTLKKFSGNDGDLFYLTIKVPNDGDGIITYPIWLRKTLLTTTDEEEIGALETFGNVNVYFYILGDVDHSDNITVADIVQTARYILNYNPEPFVFEAADMNGDGKITITDVVKIANLILDQNYEEPTNMRMMAPNVEGDGMSGQAIGNTISINLDNEQDYTAFQMD